MSQVFTNKANHMSVRLSEFYVGSVIATLHVKVVNSFDVNDRMWVSLLIKLELQGNKK